MSSSNLATSFAASASGSPVSFGSSGGRLTRWTWLTITVSTSGFHPRNSVSGAADAAIGWLHTRCRNASSCTRRFSTKSWVKRPTTPLSGSGGTTTPGCTSTSAPRSATNSEKRWRHDVALPITVVVIR